MLTKSIGIVENIKSSIREGELNKILNLLSELNITISNLSFSLEKESVLREYQKIFNSLEVNLATGEDKENLRKLKAEYVEFLNIRDQLDHMLQSLKYDKNDG